MSSGKKHSDGADIVVAFAAVALISAVITILLVVNFWGVDEITAWVFDDEEGSEEIQVDDSFDGSEDDIENEEFKTVRSDWLSLEVPESWTVTYVNRDSYEDNDYSIRIYPEDCLGYIFISSAQAIEGAYEEFYPSVESDRKDDCTSEAEEFTVDEAVVHRYAISSDGVVIDGEAYRGFYQYVYSGSEYKLITIYRPSDEYEFYAEEVEYILDSMNLSSTSSPEDPADDTESEEEAATEDLAELAKTTMTDDGVSISESLPYEGMDSKFIDVTWLGNHDGEDAVVENGSKAGSVPYYWLADNDTGDRVFTVYVLDGEVIAVYRNNFSLDYWYNPDEGSLDYPDLDAAGDSYVYITETGSKYHIRSSCTGLNNANDTYEVTLTEAESRGFEPCEICY